MVGQRGDVKDKYEDIYRDVDLFVRQFISASRAPTSTTYKALQALVPAVWALAAGFGDNGTGAAYPLKIVPTDHVPTIKEPGKRLQKYFDTPESWTERGVKKAGSRAALSRDMDTFYTQEIIRYAQNHDLVLDLGCGWGHRMVNLYVSGANAQFIGGDRSQHSRSVNKAVTGLFPQMRAGWCPFDFTAPDFSGMPSADRVCVFTVHAIEQVKSIGIALFDALLRRFPNSEITGVHLEPIAAQIDERCTGAAAYAAKREYNQDLFASAHHPQVEIVASEAVIFDLGDDNPTSLLVWKKR